MLHFQPVYYSVLAFGALCTLMLGRWMRPEKDVRLLWSKLMQRTLRKSSGGDRSTILWEKYIFLRLYLSL